VDQSISRWDEFFIPANLAESMAQMSAGGGAGKGSMVLEDVMLYESSLKAPPAQPGAWWPRYLLLAAGILAVALFSNRLVRWICPLRLARAWLLLAALAGTAIIYLWVLTDHEMARYNLNLALFNPLWLLCWAGRRYFFLTACLLVALGSAAVLMTQLPPHQYTADVLAAFLPLNLAAAWVLLRAAHKP